ncbi:PIN domain-containing protein [Desulfonema limicola]|nr:PIN domain-containing protein [Desulfonema limicola]
MENYLLDTNHCIYVINGIDKKTSRKTETEHKVIKKIKTIQSEIFISEVTLGELYFGAANSNRKEYNLKRIELFKQIIMPVTIDEDIWRLFGETKAMLRKRGKSIADMDLLIACTSRIFGFILVTNDKDFDVLPDDFLKENWAE